MLAKDFVEYAIGSREFICGYWFFIFPLRELYLKILSLELKALTWECALMFTFNENLFAKLKTQGFFILV